jgi:predicted nucleic acid-binding protein
MNNFVFPALIDTEVVVSWAQGYPPATLFFLARNKLGAPQISRLSALGMLASCPTDRDRGITLRMIQSVQLMDITDAIIQRAFDLLTTTPLPTLLTASDAIIAATALEHSLPLYTLNPTRFTAVPGITTLQPY